MTAEILLVILVLLWSNVSCVGAENRRKVNEGWNLFRKRSA